MMHIIDSIIWVPGLLLALTIHEYAHGRMAYELGDPTPARAGRLTLNPLAHLDIMGTIALFLFHIGWAKPVPINPYYFQNPKRDIALVSIAGPGANFILAVITGIMAKVLSGFSDMHFWRMLVYTMEINVVLMIFNLIPIPPLDGSKLLFMLAGVSEDTAMALERIGPILLIAVIFIGGMTGLNILWLVISPFLGLFHLLIGI